jgi:hypothetical protein
MKFLGELAAELLRMFLGDGRLAGGVLAIVAAAALASAAGLSPYAVGAILLVGGLLLLIENVRHATRGRNQARAA